ncbi:MAG: hypothetical protein OEZ68_21790, partial [Gammaproteobacteria bacterium]|nr:hypothetical protein [Gammaproteobacteria bacterium]
MYSWHLIFLTGQLDDRQRFTLGKDSMGNDGPLQLRECRNTCSGWTITKNIPTLSGQSTDRLKNRVFILELNCLPVLNHKSKFKDGLNVPIKTGENQC